MVSAISVLAPYPLNWLASLRPGIDPNIFFAEKRQKGPEQLMVKLSLEMI
jgi:hypothetical protein